VEVSSDVSLVSIAESEKETLIPLFVTYHKELTVSDSASPQLAIEIDRLNSYWSETNRFPYFIRTTSGSLAGFVLVNDYCEQQVQTPRFSIAEFYIIPEYRRKSMGSQAALQAFSKHSGFWEVRVLPDNKSGQLFWRNVITLFSKGHFTETSNKGCCFLFAS
jgi:predicted acetyltransferase